MTNKLAKHRIYLNKLDELQRQITEDFEYYSKQNSAIDCRLNELGKRGDVEATAEEMTELLEQRAVVKDIAIKLLPLRDLFRNGFEEVLERVERAESYER